MVLHPALATNDGFLFNDSRFTVKTMEELLDSRKLMEFLHEKI